MDTYFTGRLDTIGSKFKQNKTIMKQCREGEVNLFRITGWDKMDKTIESFLVGYATIYKEDGAGEN